jgi:hypothetical protein
VISRLNATVASPNVNSINLNSLNLNANNDLFKLYSTRAESSDLLSEYSKINKGKIGNGYTLFIQKNYKQTAEKNPGKFYIITFHNNVYCKIFILLFLRYPSKENN